MDDQKVRAHEQAHISAGRSLNVTPATFDYEKGPDGKNYAVAGEVQIGFTPTDDYSDNLAKAQTLRNAALAPAEPSSQDMKVAQDAQRMITEYSQKVNKQKMEDVNFTSPSAESESKTENSTDKDSSQASDENNNLSVKNNQDTVDVFELPEIAEVPDFNKTPKSRVLSNIGL